MKKRKAGWAILGIAWVALFAGCDGADSGGDADDAAPGELPQCSDGVDNDGDDRIDLDDPDCASASDDDEGSDAGVAETQCTDRTDNDGDGRIDFDDTGCSGSTDDDESDDPGPAQCANGEDDDEDGLTDLDDRGCQGRADDDESDDPPLGACVNAVDDDADGYTDYPDDPGCGSTEDDDEQDEFTPLPQCGDGADNDLDGLIDLVDPGCTSVADPREANPETPSACANQLDDDADGVIDFPAEPGCSAAGDEDETDPDQPPECGNGTDDDDDGAVDYPVDPGCAGVGDRDEADPQLLPACSDGIDNDRDDTTDYPDDTGCESAADGNEAGSCGMQYQPVDLAADRVVRGDTRRGRFESEGSCGGRGAAELVYVYRVERTLEALEITTVFEDTALESTLYVRRACLAEDSEVGCAREPIGDGMIGNTLRVDAPDAGDYYIFVDGAGPDAGAYSLQVTEVPLAQCLNGRDDDGDGVADYPFDSGCDRPSDRDEVDPAEPTGCSDDEDNDGDGVVDFPLDFGCQSAADGDETNLCGVGVRLVEFPVEAGELLDDTSVGGANNSRGTCGGQAGADKIFLYRNDVNARLTFRIDYPESASNTVLYVRSGDCVRGRELGCTTGGGDMAQPGTGRVRIDRAAPGDYFVVVDRLNGNGAPFKLTIESSRLPAGCGDGADNDEDGFIDGDDLGCEGALDEDERDPGDGPRPACANEQDDDADGLTDYPFDVGCGAKGDVDEADPDVAPECSNGLDDDADMRTDFPNDPGCQARGDGAERNGIPPPQCGDGADNDNDGVSDYPADPGCDAAGDPSERNPDPTPVCANLEDDDRDGLVDYPYDPGCFAASHRSEVDPAVAPLCANRADDDEDGRTDFPRDPGCISAGDEDEADPRFPPQCANARDDDGDGRIDFPDDAGCRFAADADETNVGPARPRCADGVDNDDDGSVDLSDVGCDGARDNDEVDPDVVPFCADEQDNDEDMLIDWPLDVGCAAQGDDCEQGGYGRCEGVCQDIVSNPRHCGRCGRACNAGVMCIDGRCGQIRETVMVCGQPGRDVNQFIRGDLLEAEVRVVQGCVPDEDTQALLVSRGGIGELTQNADLLREYIEGGGQVITEFSISVAAYNALFGAQVAAGDFAGSCNDNIQPVVQFSPEDAFWQDNEFEAINPQISGCGQPIPAGQIPDFVPLGGWAPNQVSFGYVELGVGRLWLLEADWQDGQDLTPQSLDLMAYMITGGQAAGALIACNDGRDNDGDGAIDLFDLGCADEADVDEAQPDNAESVCLDGRDNDRDGRADFPLDPGCSAAADGDEVDPEVAPACSNVVDDDNDGLPDWPFDPGCAGRGDNEETDPGRRAQCGNGRDDDRDGLPDFPADPGCTFAADPDEADPAEVPRCANALDDDRDGVTDWPFDPGCESASGDNERNPAELAACANGEDDDGDGRVDFPLDPGCDFAADPAESDRGREPPQCANRVDDDGDGLADFPEDRGCRFAADRDETDRRPELFARCANGVDDDGDALVDAQDPGCLDRDDEDESDDDVGALCNNGEDDDRDGDADWPGDPGCQARGDRTEDQSCRPGLDVELIPQNGTVRGRTAEGGPDNFSNRCGGRDAPEAVYRYRLDAPATVRFSAANPGTEFPVVLSVRTDCEEDDSQLACAGNFAAPEPTVTLEDAPAGDYFVFVDGGGPEQIVSRGGDVLMPPEPQDFQAQQDLQEGCGWGDGGNDAFDCFGQISVAFGGQEVSPPVLPQGPVELNAGGFAFNFTSDFAAQGVWRLRFDPLVEGDESQVTITVIGNLGSDGQETVSTQVLPFEGYDLTYFESSDNNNFDPPVTLLFVASDPQQQEAIAYGRQGDNITITATDIKLPAVLYVAVSYAGHQNVAPALLEDLEIRGAGPDAAVFGNFELSVTEQP